MFVRRFFREEIEIEASSQKDKNLDKSRMSKSQKVLISPRQRPSLD